MTPKHYIYDIPELMAEWNWEKNNTLGLDPSRLTYGSNKKAWWKCKKCGHKWKTDIGVRTIKKCGCPKCAVQKRLSQIDNDNRLDIKYPEIAAEWHPNKNGALTPHNVGYTSHQKVWWQCSICGHEWCTAVRNRTASINAGDGCKSCKLSIKEEGE